jgi:hypothetical protein
VSRFVLEYAIRNVQENREEMQLNRTYQPLVYANDVNTLGGKINTKNKNKETISGASRGVGVEVNADKTKYTVLIITKLQTK